MSLRQDHSFTPLQSKLNKLPNTLLNTSLSSVNWQPYFCSSLYLSNSEWSSSLNRYISIYSAARLKFLPAKLFPASHMTSGLNCKRNHAPSYPFHGSLSLHSPAAWPSEPVQGHSAPLAGDRALPLLYLAQRRTRSLLVIRSGHYWKVVRYCILPLYSITTYASQLVAEWNSPLVLITPQP
jgi:hypothetical protein